MRTSRRSKIIAVGTVLALTIAACGGGDDDDSGDGAATEEDAADSGDDTEEDAADSGDDAATEEDAADSGDGTEEDAADSGDVIEEGTEAEGDVDTEVEENTDERVYGGTVTIGQAAESVGLRPWEDTASSDYYTLAIAVFDKLMEVRADGSVGPFLAESITPNDDFTEWVMTLRPDIMFHNAVPLTAQTIADMFAIQLTGAQSQGAIENAGLTDVQATGELEVTYTLSATNAIFPALLERSALGMVFEPAAAAADPAGFANNPIGTGPFVMDKRDVDNETVVVRNENYWMSDAQGNQLPFLDSIVFKPITEEGQRLQALQSGTVDALQTLRQATIRDARAANTDGQWNMYEFQGNNSGGGYYNISKPPYDDVRVRRALTLMANQEALIESLGGTGISLPGSQWFSPDSPWYSEAAAAAYPSFDFEAGVTELQTYVDDPERSDGKAPGESISVDLGCVPDPTLTAYTQVLEQLWSTSGLVDVEIKLVDQATHINNALGGPDNNFNGIHGAHCWRVSADSDPSTQLNWHGPPEETPGNFYNFYDEEVAEWLAEALLTDDFETRKSLYEKVMIRFGEQAVFWYSGHTATLVATTNDILGLNSWVLPGGDLGIGHPSSEVRWGQVWIES